MVPFSESCCETGNWMAKHIKYQIGLQENSKHFTQYNLNMKKCALVKCMVQWILANVYTHIIYTAIKIAFLTSQKFL